VAQSIIWEARDLVLQFGIADEKGRLRVVYHGSRPNMFRDGTKAVVEGRYTCQGIFQTRTLLLECPTKYEEASTGG
jgi:cytochrome c-type biogenesis protein CcmE